MDPVRAAVFLAGAVAFLSLYATQALLPQLRHAFAASLAGTSLTVGITTLAVALSAPAVGLVTDRLGRRPVIIAAIFLLALPTALAGFSGSLAQLLVWRLVQGVVTPFIFVTTVAYVGEGWQGGERGAMTSLYIGGTVVGGFASRFVSGTVADLWNWRGAFLVMAAITVAAGLAVMRWLPPTAVVRTGDARTVRPRFVDQVRLLAADRRIASTWAVGGMILSAMVATFTYIQVDLADPPFRLGSAAIGGIFGVYLLGAAVTPVAGRWIGRLGHRRFAALVLPLTWVGLALTLVPVVAVVVLGLALFACGIFMAQAAATDHVAMAGGALRSVAVGLYVACYYLGGSIGAVIPAMVWPVAGWPGCAALVAVVTGGAIATVLIGWRPPPTAPVTSAGASAA